MASGSSNRTAIRAQLSNLVNKTSEVCGWPYFFFPARPAKSPSPATLPSQALDDVLFDPGTFRPSQVSGEGGAEGYLRRVLGDRCQDDAIVPGFFLQVFPLRLCFAIRLSFVKLKHLYPRNKPTSPPPNIG